MTHKTMHHRCLDLNMCLLTTAILFAALSGCHCMSVKEGSSIFLDAGSTSTKLKIYKWRQVGPSTPEISLFTKEKFKPGIASFENDYAGLGNYIGNILTKAREVLNTSSSQTPIFLFGTAGFRYLPAETSQKLILDLKGMLGNSGFRMPDNNVQVISGEEEAAYLWVAANYLEGYFEKMRQGKAPDTVHEVYHKRHDSVMDLRSRIGTRRARIYGGQNSQSSGVMEIGGGSMQIAFQPSLPLYGEEFHIRVAGKLYQIYTQSYFNFGVNGINSQIVEKLVRNHSMAPAAPAINDPCMLCEDEKTETLSFGNKITVVGTGKPRKCLQILKELVSPSSSEDCQLKPCAIGSVYQPKLPDMKFYAVGMFAPRGIIKLREDQVLRISDLERAARLHCMKSLSVLESEGKSTKYASGDCLMGLYVPTFLTQSYGFDRNTSNIIATDEINGQSIDWALGAMLIQLNQENGYSLTRKRK